MQSPETTYPALVESDNSLLKRLAWLILGFNMGFIVPTVFIFVLLPNVSLGGGDSASADSPTQVAFIILPFEASPTPTVIASPTLTPSPEVTIIVPTAEVAQAEISPTAEVSPTLPPTATHIPATPTPLPAPSSYALTGVTFQLQTWNNCGPANLAMGLSYYGLKLTQKETADYLKPNTEDKNVSPDQMAAYVNQNTDLRALYRVAGSLDLLRWLVSNNFMVIVETAYSTPEEGWLGHYRTLVGYDDGAGEFHFYDSNYGRAARPMIPEPAAKFDSEWQAFNRTYIVIYDPARETELRDYLGRDWNEMANWRYAADLARQEAAAAPDNVFTWFNLGSSLTKIGDYQTASQAFDQAFNLGSLPWRMLWYQFGPYEAYYQTTRFDDVQSLAETAIKTTPYIEESYYYLGRVYEVRGDLEAARAEYKKSVDFNPNFAPASEALARVGGA